MAKKRAEPTVIKSESIAPKKGRRGETLAEAMTGNPDPGHRWERPLQAPGRMQVDFEERVDFRRLHDYRLARTRKRPRRIGPGRDARLRPVQHPLHLLAR